MLGILSTCFPLIFFFELLFCFYEKKYALRWIKVKIKKEMTLLNFVDETLSRKLLL